MEEQIIKAQTEEQYEAIANEIRSLIQEFETAFEMSCKFSPVDKHLDGPYWRFVAITSQVGVALRLRLL